MTDFIDLNSGVRVAVDIGGTFTDAVALWPDGRIQLAKVLSAPGHQDQSVLTAVTAMGIELGDVLDFIHGTTTGLNALLERRGARTAMVVTRGFRDVYEVGRANRAEIYNLHFRRAERLLRRRDVFEIDERLYADGVVREELDEGAVAQLADRLRDQYEAVAVCFLHAYRHPQHERRAAELLRRKLPGVDVVASHEVVAEWREYERWSTTLVSAYVTPKIRAYLGSLEQRLADGGLRNPLHVMQSNGGIMTAQTGLKRAAQTLFSGPVGGTVAAAHVGREIDSHHLICVDMGGTSFDVSLVVDGEAEIDTALEVEGHPLLLPSVAVHSLGAGGGSIVHVSAGGLRIGPESAGAVPGPACYGNGGVHPTITDANAYLGRIPRGTLLGDSLEIDVAASERALESVGAVLDLDARAVALGAVAIANSTMCNGIRELTVERGIDPRDFDLVAFGGAGPLHAAALASELGIRRVVVPRFPGVLSAYGMLHADFRHDLVRSHPGRIESLDWSGVQADLEALLEQGRALLAHDGLEGPQMSLRVAVDLRYLGQEYTLTVAVHDHLSAATIDTVVSDFHAAYSVRYGHSNPAEQVELVNVRVTAIGHRPDAPACGLDGHDEVGPQSRAETDFGDGMVATSVFRREALAEDWVHDGPVIVLESSCTTLVPEGWRVNLTKAGHLIMEHLA